MGILTFQAAAGGALNLNGPNIAGTVNLTLPSADGTSGQPLQTNGSGTLSFANLAIANGGTGTTSFTANQIHYGSFSQSANLTFDGTNLATTGSLSAANTFGFKNRIINGGMVIDQRNAGASVSNPAATTTYTLDRWWIYGTSASKFTCQQNAGSVTPPAGFINYLGITSSAATTPAATDLYVFSQKVEGLNTSDLAWGTANAATVTLSFWVRSSLTGTFSGSLGNNAANRNYVFSYTISSANTWEQKSVTIAGDTSGTWLTTNGTGLQFYWNLGCGTSQLGTAGSWGSTFYYGSTGSQSVIGTNGATFYITGVQLEKGSTATSFDFRSYGTELALCQRYYESVNYVTFTSNSSMPNSGNFGFIYYSVLKRSTPTVTLTSVSGTANRFTNLDGFTNAAASSANVYNNQINGFGVYQLSGAALLSTNSLGFGLVYISSAEL
jgi:hypothetical protein